MKFFTVLAFVCGIVCMHISAFAQPSYLFLRAGGGVSTASPSSPLSFVGQAVRPVDFTNAIGYGAGVLAGSVFSIGDNIEIVGEAGASFHSLGFIENQKTTFIIDGAATAGVIEHSLFIFPTILTGNALLRYRLGNFTLGAGLQLALFSATQYDQSEHILSPAGVSFIGGGTIQYLAEGAAFPSFFNAGAVFNAGLSRFRLAGRVNVEPFIEAVIPFAAENTFAHNRFELGFRFSLRPRPTHPPVVGRFDLPPAPRPLHLAEAQFSQPDKATYISPLSPAPRIEKKDPLAPLLGASVDLRFVNAEGAELLSAGITIRPFVEKSYFPLLPYIFFEEQISSLPPRYRSTASNNKLSPYYNIFATLAERLQQNVNAVITLIGYASGEENATPLAEERAKEVKRKILLHVPGDTLLAGRVLTVGKSNLPPIPSPADLTTGKEENRRVEILSTHPAILAPVSIEDTLLIADPPTLRFRPSVFSELGISRWELRLAQKQRLLASFAGNGQPPEFIDWNIQRSAARPRADLPVKYVLSLIDNSGQEFSTDTLSLNFSVPKTLEAEEKLPLIEKFALLLFDFNSGRLSDKHEEVLSMIQSRLAPQSHVGIVGTTDVTGSADYNRKLSLERAKEAARRLNLPATTAEGKGADGTTYPNHLPEGRFYSRTVVISIGEP